MSDWRKFEGLFVGATPRSLINEPLEPPLSAREIARRRWRTEPELIVGGLNERTDSRR